MSVKTLMESLHDPLGAAARRQQIRHWLTRPKPSPMTMGGSQVWHQHAQSQPIWGVLSTGQASTWVTTTSANTGLGASSSYSLMLGGNQQ